MNNITFRSACNLTASDVINKGEDATSLRACLAFNKTTRKQAYELRHASYLMAGLMNRSAPGGILRDEFDERVTSKTIVLYKDGIPAASARICLLDPASGTQDAAHVPASEIFPLEIKALLDAAGSPSRPARTVEVTKLARHPDFAKDNELIFGIFRMTGYLILHFEANFVLIVVQSRHIPFYRRLGYDVVAAPRTHPKFNAATGLMVCHKVKFHEVSANCSVMSGLSRSDGIYERFIKGDLISVTFPRAKSKTIFPIHNSRAAYLVDQPKYARDSLLSV